MHVTVYLASEHHPSSPTLVMSPRYVSLIRASCFAVLRSVSTEMVILLPQSGHLTRLSGSLDLPRITSKSKTLGRETQDSPIAFAVSALQKCYFCVEYSLARPPFCSVASSYTVTPRCCRSFASGSAFSSPVWFIGCQCRGHRQGNLDL